MKPARHSALRTSRSTWIGCADQVSIVTENVQGTVHRPLLLGSTQSLETGILIAHSPVKRSDHHLPPTHIVGFPSRSLEFGIVVLLQYFYFYFGSVFTVCNIISPGQISSWLPEKDKLI